MTSKDIYSILESKPHNPHYLKRYYNFIQACMQVNSLKTKEELGYTEKHHICPKAKDLFPEYASFSKNKWNKCELTLRQHKLAHWMLWKVYGGSQTSAFWRMCKGGNKSSRFYKELRLQVVKNQSDRQLQLSAEGLHVFQSEKFKNEQSIRATMINTERAKNSTLFAQTVDGKNFLSSLAKDTASRLISDGSHVFQSKENAEKTSKRNKDLASKNLLYFQSEESKQKSAEYNRKMASEGKLWNQSLEGREFSRQQLKKRNDSGEGPSQNVSVRNKLRDTTTKLSNDRYNRDIVQQLKQLANIENIKLGKGWWMKSDDWINDKIKEINNDI